MGRICYFDRRQAGKFVHKREQLKFRYFFFGFFIPFFKLYMFYYLHALHISFSENLKFPLKSSLIGGIIIIVF